MSEANSDFDNSVVTENSQIESENTSAQVTTAPEPIKRDVWVEEEIDEVIPQGPPPSISDEHAFPALGGGLAAAAATPSLWGPSAAVPSAVSTFFAARKPTAGVARSKNVQEAFNISNVVSLNVTKTELAKIIGELKRKYGVSIESTLSSISKDRSFIVSGTPGDVLQVRKELIRQLTKPVSIHFKVPAKTRSVIIGAGGKNLKPIVESTAARIDIERYTATGSDGENDDQIEVTIEGDIDGVEEAKQRILAIVDEETRNLTTKIVVPERIAPFVKSLNSKSEQLTVEGPNKNRAIVISGLRDDVLVKKAEINNQLQTLEIKIKTDTKAIPPKYHQFIDVKALFKNYEVVVEFPTTEDDSTVSFIGLQANIDEAVKAAREASSKVSFDSLDISKAHGHNLEHARRLGAYFEHSGILSKIASDNGIKVSVPSYKKLSGKVSSVPVEFIADPESKDNIKQARSDIIAQVNKVIPERVQSITDINPILKGKVEEALKATARAEGVYVLPLIALTDASNEIVLISLDKEEDEFAPSHEEIDSRLAKVNAALSHIRELQADIKTSVLSIPSDKQQFIEGPNGTTLRALLAEKPQIVLQLHTGESGAADDDKVFIEGSKADVAHIEKEIVALLKDAENVKDIYSFESTIQVPTVTLSRLIGKNGTNLTQLREQFSVDIDAEKNAAGEKASVKITGYKFNVKEAEQYIASASKRFADETTKTVLVPAKYRPAIIGANGQYVKRLQTKYNVSIRFQDKSDEVIIRGPTRGVSKTEGEIKELLDYEIENGYTKEITVPTKAISRVIGKAGETINRIAVDTGIDIKVRDSEDADVRIIALTGSRKGLSDAEKQINAIVKEVEDTITVELEVNPKFFRDVLGPRGSVKQSIIEKAGGSDLDKDYRRLLQIPEQGSDSNKIVSSGSKKIVDSIISQIKTLVAEKEAAVTEKLTVAKDKHRLIIGQGGSIRRSIEEEFNVRVNIPNASDKSENIALIGKPEDIAKATEKINELTADQWKEVVDVPVYLHAAVSERGAFPRKLRNEYNVEVEHGEATGKAIKLSSAFPAVPANALGDAETEAVKFTVSEEPAQTSDEDKTIPWRLVGSDEDVAKVSKLIKSLLAKFAKDDTTAFLWVKDSAVFGKVVGPQGSRLNNIRNKSGAQIYIPRNTDKVNNVVYLKGTKDALEKANKLIQAEIKK